MVQPAEVAVKHGNDAAHLLVALGANIDFGLKHALGEYTRASDRRSLIDWVEFAIVNITSAIISKTAELTNYMEQDNNA